MNTGRTIFAQLMDFVSPYEFRPCVDRYQGHYKVQTFSCWDQFLCLAFAQLNKCLAGELSSNGSAAPADHVTAQNKS